MFITFLSQLIYHFRRSPRPTGAKPIPRVSLNVECLESRDLMTAGLVAGAGLDVVGVPGNARSANFLSNPCPPAGLSCVLLRNGN